MRVQLLDNLILIQPRAGRRPQIDQHVPGLAGATLRLQHDMLGLDVIVQDEALLHNYFYFLAKTEGLTPS